jgi:MFS family permease
MSRASGRQWVGQGGDLVTTSITDYSSVRKSASAAIGRLERVAGGAVRMRVVALLATVLALDTADVGTIGAIADKLETALRISNTELGVLVALPTVVTAVATVPVGLLTDRVPRVRLLLIGVLVWSVAEAASGLSQSFTMLLLIRLALGAGTAPAGPTLSSIVGDYFPARERGQIWGLLLAGELAGAGFGFLVAGEFASLGSWRLAFFALAIPSIAVVFAVHRWLPEPARGGASRLERGATEIVTRTSARTPEADDVAPSTAQCKVAEQQVEPDAQLVLDEDPARMGLWQATRYVLRIRTNLILIVASALGYFYFTGVETFGIVFVRGRFVLSQGAAVLVLAALGFAAVLGVIVGGWLSDRLLRDGHLDGRIVVGATAFTAAALLFFPGLMLHSLPASIGCFLLAAVAFGARDAPLDAARLDIMHHRLWGRAEGVRTILRRVTVATAPIVFGVLADQLGRGPAVPGANGFGAQASASGMRLTFLVTLVTLAAGGLLTFWAVKSYRRDVATALASEEAVRDRQ